MRVIADASGERRTCMVERAGEQPRRSLTYYFILYFVCTCILAYSGALEEGALESIETLLVRTTAPCPPSKALGPAIYMPTTSQTGDAARNRVGSRRRLFLVERKIETVGKWQRHDTKSSGTKRR